ncbi:MAG: putative ATP-binding protein [Verrucomicrobiales bacterium]|nr:putative ATP-binding protein [Verrucomicrobiales bacterium]
MLQSLHIENLTVFPKADLTFGKNLNIFIGDNGLGKTHLLKAIYAGIAASVEANFRQQRSLGEPPKTELPPSFPEFSVRKAC